MTVAKVFLLVLLALPLTLFAQKPEKQVSFARESKPHTYYVQQAELWWKEVQKDSTSEENWYNYFRACRNAQGTLDWSTDFVKESPYLRMGPDIVQLMKEHIPNTFMYYYLSFLDGGVVTTNGDNLLKAYKMNPNFEGIHSSVISYAISSMNPTLRKEVNKAWFKTNYLSPGLLNYGYNVLMSLDKNAILLTQNDNDTYPLWMLQDAQGIREDVTVINIDFLILDEYRAFIFKKLGIDPLVINEKEKDINVYALNWERIVKHILNHYNGQNPLYVGMTLSQSLYSSFEDKFTLSGLAFKYTKKADSLVDFNKGLFENTFALDYLSHQFLVDQNQENVDAQNMNYLNMLKEVYDDYKKHKKVKQAEKAKTLALTIVEKTGKEEWIKMIQKEFK